MMTREEEGREKTSFWASETEAPLFDIYHKWKGTEPTDPINPEKLLVFSAGKMMELALVDQMSALGLIDEIEEDQHRIEIEREGIPITGYMDAKLKDGTPVEIKSFYGDYQKRDLLAGKPRPSYLKQLAIYVDAVGAEKGVLIYIDRGTGECFEFTLFRDGTKFRCINVEFDITDTYKRWSDLYTNHIVPGVEPESEYRYKIPVEEVDWRSLSKSDIAKARNGHKVIGDSWQVAYSPYKSLIIEREGTQLGYTDQEAEYIREATKGYTTW